MKTTLYTIGCIFLSAASFHQGGLTPGFATIGFSFLVYAGCKIIQDCIE